MSDGSFIHRPVPPQEVFRPDIFKGKVAFVTGGGSGICYALTEALMRFGAKAAIVGRKAERLAKAAEQLSRDTGSEALATPADVRKPETLAEAVKQTIDRFGKIDFVICGAAGNFMSPIEGLSPNAFRTVVEIDLLGTFNTVKATMDHVKASHGTFLHISATLHYSGLPWQSAPSAAKAGVDAFSNALAVELAPFGVRSNCIAPGLIQGTEGADRLVPKGGEDVVQSFIPLQRVGQKSDIANAAVFLFSDAASWITGQIIAVDGGHMHFRGPWLPYPDSSLDPRAFKDLFPGSRL
ncbi:2,4-dienoyl-CoA reductase [(2E)-enoyl-CoA-producing] [Malassezia cuniculi]|uniref:2,4-dienoyl-CoA reductase [(3E)-enoyl-CoA-producing] n=1 Tax=Malassezia cuniculi TaxID=948313 RepID=A0AAF0JD29_9BASI|nr:2,4-dienoyl-CoA reductase [(2E)-enoyl-CoA-producing] [Malassezia cuniculi]